MNPNPFVECRTSKVPHASLQAARREANRMMEQRKHEHPEETLSPYKCSSCGQFHVGKDNKRSAPFKSHGW
jgi:hypothetical protein